MFTGLVEGLGRIRNVQRRQKEVTLVVEPRFDMADCRVGDSVSVDGVCLTVTGVEKGAFSVDVSQETISRSTLQRLGVGDEVNLEQALRLSDRLGGHLVSGHIDGKGKILKKEMSRRSWFMRIGIDEHLSRYTIEKGSIAVDGISLTVNHCKAGFFEVNVIPHTGRETTLVRKSVGDPVNIEVDMIGKYVERLISPGSGPSEGKEKSTVDREMLLKHGFGD